MNDKPLFLPAGSVRAIMALVVVGTCSYLALTGKLQSSEFLVIVATVIGFYFGTKKTP